jgi:preprotein translocase subunit SecD
MLDFPTWKRVWLWGLTLFAIAAALPSLASITGVRWPSALPSPMVNLGLDLAGGSHILLEADKRQVAQQRLESMDESIRGRLRNATPSIPIGDISSQGGRLSFMLKNPGQVDATREAIMPLTSGAGLTGQRDWDIQVVDGTRFVITPTTEGLDQAVTNAMDTAVEVVRRRIDALGTREPTILRQGDERIVVQVPGLQDPSALKKLLGQTAKLEFKLVDVSASPEDIARGIAPPGDEILQFSKPEGGRTALAVKRLGGIKGDQLTDAKQAFDPKSNAPVVSITFNSAGGAKFAQLTSENVNRPFAAGDLAAFGCAPGRSGRGRRAHRRA